jgi:hypothetical protein
VPGMETEIWGTVTWRLRIKERSRVDKSRESVLIVPEEISRFRRMVDRSELLPLEVGCQ